MRARSRTFGPRFGELRKRSGLSHRQLAARLGCSHSLLSSSECGDTGPINQPTIIKAAHVFATDPAELIELASLDRGYVEIDAYKLSTKARRILCRVAANPVIADAVLRIDHHRMKDE